MKIDLEKLSLKIVELLPSAASVTNGEWESLDVTYLKHCLSIGQDGSIYIDGSQYQCDAIEPSMIEFLHKVQAAIDSFKTP